MIINKVVGASGRFMVITTPTPSIDGLGTITNPLNPIEVSRDSESLDLVLNFNNNSELLSGNMMLNISVHRKNGNFFDYTPIIELNNVEVRSNAHLISLPTSILQLDGEFILKITFVLKSYNSEYYNPKANYIIEKDDNYIYGFANEDDFYLNAYYSIGAPQLRVGVKDENSYDVSNVKNYGVVTTETTHSHSLLFENVIGGDVIVSVNGLTLSNTLDYDIINNVIIFKEALPKDTVINVLYTTSGTKNSLFKQHFFIQSNLLKDYNEATHGDCFVDSNGKYGLFLDGFINNDMIPIIILNGVTLSNQLDFFIDENDKRRVIFNGNLMQNDLIDVYFIPVNNILQDSGTIVSGNILLTSDHKLNEIGELIFMYSRNKNFINPKMEIIPLVPGNESYDFSIDFKNPGIYYMKVIHKKTISRLDEQFDIQNESLTHKIIIDN